MRCVHARRILVRRGFVLGRACTKKLHSQSAARLHCSRARTESLSYMRFIHIKRLHRARIHEHAVSLCSFEFLCPGRVFIEAGIINA